MSKAGSSRQMMKEMEDERQKIVQDTDDDEEVDEEEEGSGDDDLESNDSNESFGGLSSFVHNDDENSDSSLLDLDDEAYSNMSETKIVLHEMIDTCHELDERQGFQPNEDKLLRKQVKQSAALFEKQFMPDSKILEKNKTMWQRPATAASESTIDDENESMHRDKNKHRSKGSKSRRQSHSKSREDSSKITLTKEDKMTAEAVKPSDMYLVYKHTNMCAHLMQKRTEVMGLEDTIISIDDYIVGVKRMAREDDFVNSNNLPGAAELKILSSAWKTAPYLPTFVGSFDYKAYLDNEGIVPEKPVKKEVKRRVKHFDPDCLIATQVEVSISKEASAAKSKENDQSIKDFQKRLIDFAGKDFVNIHEFTLNKTSLRDSLNNMFTVAFGVRDGTISLTREGSDMKIAPLNAPSKKEKEASNRRQCIISIGASRIRELQGLAQGENVIPSTSHN